MSHQQQGVRPRASSNGFPHRNINREDGGRHESRAHLMKSSSGGLSNAENGGKLGHASSSRDRLIYVMAQLIGYHVDVHVKNGSVISGIFHATNSEKDFGIVLKMAHLMKDASVRGQRAVSDVVKKPETMIIPARELVQVLAKDIALGGDELLIGPVNDKRKDLMIDSAISHSHHPEERELERWAPDEDNSEFIELDKYDRKWNRSWDQFETNATLFGVKSTFNEELYTTKLDRGPHMRELEKQASRIAREIEHEVTEDTHLAEERGLYLDGDLDQDEERKYSAVCRDVDNSRSNLLANASSTTHASDSFTRTANNEQQESSSCSSVDKELSSHVFDGTNLSSIISTNIASQLTSLNQSNKLLPLDEESRLDEKLIQDHSGDKDNESVQFEKALLEGSRPSIFEDSRSPPSTSDVYESSSSVQGNKSSDGTYDSSGSGKHSSAVEHVNPSQQPGSSMSSTSERVAANSVLGTPGLSPSSSMGSLSSEKSTLNPNAKEFKLNPNAKSFSPSSSLRPPHPPASDGSFYYPNNMPTAPLGPGLPMCMGFQSAFAGQTVVYNAQPGQLPSPQGYLHAGGSPYGQQMMLGHTRPVYYYTPEMQQYRGRNF